MKITAISDLHGFLPVITEPAEIMLIAGDISPFNIQQDKRKMHNWLRTKFSEWILSIPVQKVFLIAGNHDFYFEGLNSLQLGSFREACDFKLNYLENNYLTYHAKERDITIFGTPYCHYFGNWPFMRNDDILIEKFNNIPDKVDIILSHDPPFAINDSDFIFNKGHVGNKPLTNRLQEVNYKLLVCGHIHTGDHNFSSACPIVNVSHLDDLNQPNYGPLYLDLQL